MISVGVYGARAIPSTYSGYETFLTVLLPALAARGHKVTMYCRSAWLGSSNVYRGVELVPVPALETKRWSTLSHGALATARSRIRRHDVGLIVNVANAPYCTLSRLTGQRIVLNTDGQEWLRGKWGRLARTYFWLCAREARWSASALVSDCYEMKRIYATQFGADSTVIPYSSALLPAGDTLEIMQRYGVAPRGFVVVAARLNPENNVHRIAEAYTRSALKWPLLVLGAANYDSEVGRRVKQLAGRDSRIRSVGHVDDRGAFAVLLREALAYVHGHSVGGMNPSLVEAMSAGALIIALRTPFNREVLGDAGIYFDVDDHEMVDLFTYLPALEKRVGDRYRSLAQKIAEERYGLPVVVDAYEELLRRAAGLRHAWQRIAINTQWDMPPPSGYLDLTSKELIHDLVGELDGRTIDAQRP
jgi:glycosyltransferase involved in cell wall biosynthesis